MKANASEHKLSTWIQEVDSLIRRGQQGQAREKLVELNLAQIPRQQKSEIADIARRLNMPKMMLGILKPLVYREKVQNDPASILERALYATALSRIGVFQEAQMILNDLNEEDDARILLFLAQNFMLQWDSYSAIPKLKKYLARPDISDYQRLVGQVNLASSLIGEMRWQESHEVLESIWKSVKSTPKDSGEQENLGLLYANSLGLAAHAAFLQGQPIQAERYLQEADKILIGTKSRYELLLKKWKSILILFRPGKTNEDVEEFRHMLEEARKAKDWETVRDFEFFLALALRDDALFLQVYHGTPHISYRKRIKKIYAPKFSIPKMYDWNLLGTNSNRRFDLSKGCEEGGKARLTSQPLLFQLLQLLTKDFYRPVALGSIFSKLYPKEKYNPLTSPNRTYLVIKRLRAWFEKNGIPLEIEVVDDLAKLIAKEPYQVRVSYQTIAVTKNDSYLESLEHHFFDQSFSLEQLCRALDIALSSAKKFVTWALKNQRLRKSGVGTKAKYRLK